MFERKILKNIVSLGIVQAANFLLPLLTFPYLFRTLGPKEFGLMSIGIAVAFYFVIFVDYGFNLSATKMIAECEMKKRAISEIYWNVMVAKLILNIVGIIFLIATLLIIELDSHLRFIVLMSYIAVVGNMLFPQWLFQGMEKMSISSSFVLLGRFFTLPLIFVYVKSPDDSAVAALISSSGTTLSGIMAVVYLYRTRTLYPIRPHKQRVVSLLRDSWSLFLSTASISLYTASNNIVLGWVAGPVAVGYFNSADKVKTSAWMMIAPVGNAVYPRASALMMSKKKEAYGLIRRLLLFNIISGLIVGGGLFSFADAIVVLLTGKNYPDAVHSLRLMSSLPLLISISTALGVHLLILSGFKKEFRNILLSSGVFNLALLMILGNRWGASGAALSLLITEAVVAITIFVICYRRLPDFFNAGGRNEV